MRAEVRACHEHVLELHRFPVEVRREPAAAAGGGGRAYVEEAGGALPRRVVLIALERVAVILPRAGVGDEDDDLVRLVEVVCGTEPAAGRGLGVARNDGLSAEAAQRDDDVRIGPALAAGRRGRSADVHLIQQAPIGKAAQGLDSRLQDRRERPGQ